MSVTERIAERVHTRGWAIAKGWMPYHVHGTYEDYGVPEPDTFDAILEHYINEISADGMVVHPDFRELDYDGRNIRVSVLVARRSLPLLIVE